MAVFWQSNRSTFRTVRERFEKQTYHICSNRCRTPFSGCPRNDATLNKERSKIVYSLPRINAAFNRQGHRDDSWKCKDTVWRTGNGLCHGSRQNLPPKMESTLYCSHSVHSRKYMVYTVSVTLLLSSQCKLLLCGKCSYRPSRLCITSQINGRQMGGSGSHDKNYKQAFPPHHALYCWQFTFLTTSLTAAMVDIGTIIDSQLCGLANVKCSQEKLNRYLSAKLTESHNIF